MPQKLLDYLLRLNPEPEPKKPAFAGPWPLAPGPYSLFTVKFYGQAERAISNGQLHTLLCFHIRPIDVVVFHGPS